jgi:hypothetical protein
MRFLEMLGFSAVATLAVMAFVGAPGANANSEYVVFCKQPELVCAPGNQYPLELTLLGTASNPFLKTNIGTVKCNTSHLEAVGLNHLSKSLIKHLQKLSFTGNCNLSGIGCTFTTTALGLLTLTRSGPLQAAALSTGTRLLVQCGALIHCVYGGEPVLAVTSTTETQAATITAANAIWTPLEGFLCPAKAESTAVYKFSVPATPVHIES